MTIKECIDTVDNIKPNQYETKEKVLWLSFIDEIIINDVLKTHEGYDGRYDTFAGYSEDKLSVTLIVPSPYDRLYTAYLKMKIDGENGETARYNNSAAMFNTYMMEYRKYYNKTHLPLAKGHKPISPIKPNSSVSDAELENIKRELYHVLYNDVCGMTSSDKINDVVRSYMSTNAEMFKGEKGDKGDGANLITEDGTIVSPNADFAEVAEWADGNTKNEDRTGYFVCANVPLNGIVMKKATSTDDVKGVTISAPAFAGNYSKDKVDSNGNLLPKYSYVAIIGFVPVRDNGTCTVGGRCMPDDNGCAIPSSNSMGYQVVNRIDENRVLIIIEPNGDMVQRIKTKINELTNKINQDLLPLNGGGQIYDDGSVYLDISPKRILLQSPSSDVAMLRIKENKDGVRQGELSLYDEYDNGITITSNEVIGSDTIKGSWQEWLGIGNIETALDNIIALQNQLIGGDA